MIKLTGDTQVDESLLAALSWAQAAKAKGSINAANAEAYILAVPMNQNEGQFYGQSKQEADCIQLTYVLSNLTSWKGDEARAAKAVIKDYCVRHRGY